MRLSFTIREMKIQVYLHKTMNKLLIIIFLSVTVFGCAQKQVKECASVVGKVAFIMECRKLNNTYVFYYTDPSVN